MKILMVASYNAGFYLPFITEQAESLRELGVEVDFYPVLGSGVRGYLSNRKKIVRKINEWKPDIIHAHYGLCGVLANLQRKVPVVTTYHGSDINEKSGMRFSRISMKLSAWNIFVSERNIEIAFGTKKKEQKEKMNYTLLPCGVTLKIFVEKTQERARRELGWSLDEKRVIFAGAFSDRMKNYPLAHEVMKQMDGVELVELRGYNRQQVANLFAAGDALLITSFSEGSPQSMKEAMACGCPIVSVDVGDVSERTERLSGHYITSRNPQEIADALRAAINFGRTQGRQRLIELGLTNEQIAQQLLAIYKQVLKRK